MIDVISASQPAVALIGTGNICQNVHVPCLIRAGAKIVCAIDPDIRQLAKMQQLIANIKVFRDISELPDDVECAIVSSPTKLHAYHVQALCQRKVHVLCEKPLACTNNDAEGLIATAKANNVVLQVGYYRRFHPAAHFIRYLLDTNMLGTLRSCVVLAGHIYNSTNTPASIMEGRLSGGGVLMDMGVHILDRLMSWFGCLQVAEYRDDSMGGMEANALLRLKALRSITPVDCLVLLSRTNELGYNAFLAFDRGEVVCPLNTGHEVSMTIRDMNKSGTRTDQPLKVIIGEQRDNISYFVAQWKEFIGRMMGEPELVTNVTDAIGVTALVERCYNDRQYLHLPWEQSTAMERLQ